jgi:hypothetical protein
MNKSFLKLYVVALGVALGSFTAAQAATVAFTIPANTSWNATNLISGPARITAITISTGSGGASNLNYTFNDYPGTSVANGWGPIYQTNTGYMQVSQYTTNITKVLTNFGGIYLTPDGLYSNTIVISNALWVYTNYTGLTTNIWRVIANGAVASNSVSTLTLPGNGIPVIYGLGFTNNVLPVISTVTITYNPSL